MTVTPDLSANPHAVSVIIPARNAAATLAETLDSVLAQTVGAWEAIVVDDGSDDETAAVATRYASRDERIRLLQGPAAGVSAARNRGIEAARHPWLLFLDADDTIDPGMLEAVVRRLRSRDRPDLVHVGWATRYPDGVLVPEERPALESDLFTRAAENCPFAIHAAVTRRDLVREVGAFDPDLKINEDWDLWLRCGRAGARTSHVDEVLAIYRFRSGSACMNAERYLDDGLRVIDLIHGPDPRVARPLPEYGDGLPRGGIAAAEYSFASYTCGLVIAQGGDASDILERFADRPCPALTPPAVAFPLLYGVARGRVVPPARWPDFWPEVRAGVLRFLDAIEARSGSPDLASRSLRQLLDAIVEMAPSPVGDLLDGIYDVAVDLEEDRVPEWPGGTERLVCRIEYRGEPLGRVAVPPGYRRDVAGLVRELALREYAWSLLRAHYLVTHGGDVVSSMLGRVVGSTLGERFAPRLLRVRKRGYEWLERGLLRRGIARQARKNGAPEIIRDALREVGESDFGTGVDRFARRPAASRATSAERIRLFAQRVVPATARLAGASAIAVRMPILMYHSVAPWEPGGAARYRIDPEAFAAHLRTLRDLGFYSASLDEWWESITGGHMLRGRPVLLTFDDGFADFDEHAWPLLRKYGFGALVFVVTDLVGRTSEWDRSIGLEAPLMGWDRIRALEREGVVFGSHSVSHRSLGSATLDELVHETGASLRRLRDELDRPLDALAYPYGDSGRIAQCVAREEGYRFGLSVHTGPATPYSRAMDVPRIEVCGWDGPRDLAVKLGVEAPELPEP